jgi:hypothetical protein
MTFLWEEHGKCDDWWYPGESPERDPIPKDVLNEIKGLL